MTRAGFPHSPTVLTVDLDAIASNWRTIRDVTSHKRAAAVVKADGYGCGIGPVARALTAAGCDTFFVAHLDEAIELRGIVPASARITAMNGLLPGGRPHYMEHGVWPMLNDLGQLAAWRDFAAQQGRALPACLHLDTGMSRLGLDRAETKALLADPGRLDGVELRFLVSHLACADTPADPMNRDQRNRFSAAAARLPAPVDGVMLAASSGAFLGPDYHFDWIRPGIALFGGRPNTEIENPFKPVVRLDARILQLRQIDAPESVGYGAAYNAERPARIATLAVGYADGYLRSLSGKTKAWVGEIEVPVVGRISMDLLTVDVSAVPSLQPGDTVGLIGPRHTADDVADLAGTISYEILTGLGRRYARHYVGGPADEVADEVADEAADGAVA